MHRRPEPTEALPDARHGVPGDARLIGAIRDGSGAAYDVLVGRHRGAAVRVAAELVGHEDADRVVDLALQSVLTTLLAGGGPEVAFRPYVLAAVVAAAERRTSAPTDPAEIWRDGSDAGTAMSRIPEESRLLLWHLDVEGEHPLQVAPLLDVPTHEIPALLRDARQALFLAHPGVPSAASLAPVLLGETADRVLLERAPSPLVRRSFVSAARVPAARTAAAVAAVALIGAGAVTAAFAAAPSDSPTAARSAAGTGTLPIVPAPSTTTDAPAPATQSAPQGGSDVSPEALASATSSPSASPSAPPDKKASKGEPRAFSSTSPSSSAPSAGTPSADVGIAARSSAEGVTWNVSGLPSGSSTVVTIVAESGMTMRSTGDDCTGDGSGQLTCTVTAGQPSGSFTVTDLRLGDGQISLSVQPVAGLEDPEPRNNDSTVTS